MTSKLSDQRLFHGLDGLRGIAALAVVLFHYGVYLEGFHLGSSYLAVDLFFALSGFVLSYSYDARFRAGLSFRRFMTLRLVRLYPLYILGLVLGCVSFVLSAGSPGSLYRGISDFPFAVISGIMFLPTWPGLPVGTHLMFPLNLAAWSLFFELIVNALYALLAPYLNNRLLGAIVSVGALALLGSAYVHHGLNTGVHLHSWDGGLVRVIYAFFAGVGLYRLWAAGKLDWLRLPFWLCGIVLLAIFAFEPPRMRGLYDYCAALVLFPALILAATREPRARWVPLLSLLGEISYAIYILHVPIIATLRAYVYTPGIPTQLLPLGASALMGSIALALIAHRYYDVPLRRWLGRRMNAKAWKPN